MPIKKRVSCKDYPYVELSYNVARRLEHRATKARSSNPKLARQTLTELITFLRDLAKSRRPDISEVLHGLLYNLSFSTNPDILAESTALIKEIMNSPPPAIDEQAVADLEALLQRTEDQERYLSNPEE